MRKESQNVGASLNWWISSAELIILACDRYIDSTEWSGKIFQNDWNFHLILVFIIYVITVYIPEKTDDKIRWIRDTIFIHLKIFFFLSYYNHRWNFSPFLKFTFYLMSHDVDDIGEKWKKLRIQRKYFRRSHIIIKIKTTFDICTFFSFLL